jgi:hypothetical protein
MQWFKRTTVNATFLVCANGAAFAQFVPPFLPRFTPSAEEALASRYEQLPGAGNEIRDAKTGLIWLRCLIGQNFDSKGACVGQAQTFTHENALKVAKNIGGDWRLPSYAELLSIVPGARSIPTFTPAFPVNVQNEAWIWSSSPAMANSDKAMAVRFDIGSGKSKDRDTGIYVRLVRLAPSNNIPNF